MKWLVITLLFLTTSAVARKHATLQDIIKFNDPVAKVPQPHFPGGERAWAKFLQRNLRWPDGFDGQGRVIVSFDIEKNGALTHFKIERGLEATCDNEALRVLRKSPRWIPAKKNGKPIKLRYFVPINFTLSN